MKNKELAKKVMYITAGLALASKQKIEAMVQEFIDKSEMSEDEGKKLLEEIIAKANETREEFEAKLEEAIHKVLDKMHITTKAEYDELKKRIEKLEAKKTVVQ